MALKLCRRQKISPRRKFLINRAWNRILNFSEDQLRSRPEKTMLLWRWVLQHILMQKRSQEAEEEEEEKRGKKEEEESRSRSRSQSQSQSQVSSPRSPQAAVDCEKGQEGQEEQASNSKVRFPVL